MKISKKTKIIATIGPSTNNSEILLKMRQSGMNICRINFSHTDEKGGDDILKNIKKAEKDFGRSIAVLQDLSGPKIRTGEFKNGEAVLKKGDIIQIGIKKILGDNNFFTIEYKDLLKDLKKNHRILINDGKQELLVLSVGKVFLKARVIVGGFIRSKRGVNLPDTKLSISALTSKDKEDIRFGIKNNIEFIAFSFVKTGKDVLELRNILNKAKSKSMLISKIETPQAIENFDEILELSDGIMVARGDLAVEVEAHKVPHLQKMMIRKCNAIGKPVITATQMMDSMIKSPVPTRAEVSDIYNAISDGTDAVMLSEETAMGEYPLQVIQTVTRVALEAESKIDYKVFMERNFIYKSSSNILIEDSITRYAGKTAEDINAKIVIALTESGRTSRLISRYRPSAPVYVFSPNMMSLRQSSISFGTRFGTYKNFSKVTEAIKLSRNWALKNKIVKKGDKVVLVAGMPFKKVGGTNTVTVFEV